MNEPGFGVSAPGSGSASWPELRPFSGSAVSVVPEMTSPTIAGLGLQDLRLALDLDSLLDAAELETDVDAADLPRLELNRLGRGGLEAAQLGLHHVGADRQRW